MKLHIPHTARYILVALISIVLAFVEIQHGHVDHHSMSLLADGLHYASHGVVAIVSLVLAVFNFANSQRIRAINLVLLCFLVIGSVGFTTALLIAGYDAHHALSAPSKIAVIAFVAVIGGLIQLALIGHEHDEENGSGKRFSHDDVCFGLRWHMYADVLKSILFITLACFALILTPESYQELDSKIAIGIALIYGLTMIPVVKRIAQKVAK